jgi:hypothetical protein
MVLDLVNAANPELAKLLGMVHGRLMTQDTLPVVLQLLMTDSRSLGLLVPVSQSQILEIKHNNCFTKRKLQAFKSGL